MKHLSDCKEKILSCSKCGLCQSVCPIYKITGNDCTVSRGHFIMLKGVINNELKMSKTINKYLDLCLKCNACKKFCPSGIDVAEIVTLAKAEFFNSSKFAKFKSFIFKIFIIDFYFKFNNLFCINKKSKKYEKKVVYFGGCNSKSNRDIIKIFNRMGVEVISPDFDCCGLPFLLMGDLEQFNNYKNSFYKIIEKYKGYDIITTCANCEKALNLYSKFDEKQELKIKNIFKYMKENDFIPELKKHKSVTFHKPCNLDNFNDVIEILKNIKNLKYIQMEEYDKCCGFNSIINFKEYKTMLKLFCKKYQNIKKSGAKIVLTSCFGCKLVLKIFSFGKYRVMNFTEFLAKNMK